MKLSPEEMLRSAEDMIKKQWYNGYTAIGHMYRDRYGKPQDYAEAAKHYSLAAAKGDAEGMFGLVSLFVFVCYFAVLTDNI